MYSDSLTVFIIRILFVICFSFSLLQGEEYPDTSASIKSPKKAASLALAFPGGGQLFNGDAGSGESNIRKWIIENDWLETIIALPTELFYNTGIATYVWIVTNKKSDNRRGKIQLIDATKFYKKMKKSALIDLLTENSMKQSTLK